MWSVPRLCELNPVICLTTEEKNGKTSVWVVKGCCFPLPKHPHHNIPTISTPTLLHKPHTSIQYKTHTYTPLHFTKIYKTTQYNYKQIQYNHTITYPPYPHPHYYISLTHPYSTKPTHTHPHTLQRYTKPHSTNINKFNTTTP